MEQVDTRRLRRVMERVCPPELPPPEPCPPPPSVAGDDACRMLNSERKLYRTLQRSMRMSLECRRALGNVLGRCGQRERRLRTQCFLFDGRGTLPPEPVQGRGGILSSLRKAEGLLRELSVSYQAVADRQKERRELYLSFSRECARDAEYVERLLERALR